MKFQLIRIILINLDLEPALDSENTGKIELNHSSSVGVLGGCGGGLHGVHEVVPRPLGQLGLVVPIDPLKHQIID